ncbi:MAG: hypothetical protein RIS47_423 [Bacteroidota bacterium]|jgi:hypothetical protein
MTLCVKFAIGEHYNMALQVSKWCNMRDTRYLLQMSVWLVAALTHIVRQLYFILVFFINSCNNEIVGLIEKKLVS